MVTTSPPVNLPTLGEMEEIVGAGTTKVNVRTLVELPPGPTTTRFADPGLFAGVRTVTDVVVFDRIVAGTPSNVAAEASPRFEPETTTVDPPSTEPDEAVIDVTTGARSS